MRGLNEGRADEERERDADERELEARQPDVAQTADAHEMTIRNSPLPPERSIREHRREHDVGDELGDPRVREDHVEVERRYARPRNEERERVRSERDAEPHEPRPRSEG